MTNHGSDQHRSALSRVFQTRDQTRAFYDKISKFYDLLAERSEAPVRRQGLKLLAACEGETVLEVGSGTGHCLVRLARAVGSGGTVHGVDLSEGMVRQARARVRRSAAADRVKLQQADATALPFEDGSIDAVFMSFTLELFDTPEIPVVLGECRRVLRPGGRIVVVGMSKGTEGDTRVKLFEWSHEHFPNFVDCRPIYVRDAVEEAGFVVDRVLTTQMWIPVELVLAHPP